MKLQRHVLTPQMLQYDDFDDRSKTRYLPYLMYFHRADYRSDVVNTDRFGFRISHGQSSHASIGSHIPEGPVNLLVGSSTVFGIGATSDAWSISSRLWTQHAPALPWLNFGGRSYNSVQELMLFLFHHHAVPEIQEIVFVSGFNNLALSRLPRWQQGDQGAFFYCGEYFEQMNELQARQRKGRGSVRRGDRGPEASTPEDVPVPDSGQLIANAAELTARHLAGWRRLASYTGARISFVLQPLATWVRTKPARQEEILFAELDKISKLGILEDLFGDIISMDVGRGYAEALRIECEKQDIRFLDLNPVLAEATTSDDWLYVDRAHLTDEGSDIVAKLLTERLNLT